MSLWHKFIRRLKLHIESRYLTKYQILLYHRVVPFEENDNPLKLKVTPETFETTLKKFLDEGYRFHFVEDLVKTRFNGFGAKDIALTFDDGYHDNHEYAYPILKKLKIPATVFITTSFVEEENPMWWDVLLECSRLPNWPADKPFFELNQKLKSLPPKELKTQLDGMIAKYDPKKGLDFREYRAMSWQQLREMQDSGLVRFEPHTHTHVNLAHLSYDEAKAEIETSKNILEDKLERECRLFAYPFGSIHDYNEQTLDLLADMNFTNAFLAYGKNNTRWTHPFLLDRSQIL